MKFSVVAVLALVGAVSAAPLVSSSPVSASFDYEGNRPPDNHADFCSSSFIASPLLLVLSLTSHSKVAVDLVPRVVVSSVSAVGVDSEAACSANVSVVELVPLAQVVPTTLVVETPAHSTQLPKMSSIREQCSTAAM